MTPRIDRPTLPEAALKGAPLAFYSSLHGGIVTDPQWMTVPADDHLVHRGDGVFETIKWSGGRLYLLDPHLQRLRASAEAIHIELRWSALQIGVILNDTVAAAAREDVLVRVLVSRGPGGFGVSPYDSPEPQLYAAVYTASPPFMVTHPDGARAGVSDVPVKPSLLARIKSCNYLPNALMKREAVDRGLHFVVGVDERGHVAESFTENLCIVDSDGTLVRPPGDFILAGTTMNRCFELAAELGIETETRGFTVDEVKSAREVLVFGTTAEVTAVTEFDGQDFGAGDVFRALAEALRADMSRS